MGSATVKQSAARTEAWGLQKFRNSGTLKVKVRKSFIDLMSTACHLFHAIRARMEISEASMVLGQVRCCSCRDYHASLVLARSFIILISTPISIFES